MIEYDIFISFASEQRDFAEKLAKDLRNDDFKVWIAIDSIYGGDNWIQVIEDGIEKSCLIVLVWSQGAGESEYVRAEWGKALRLKKRIIPLLRDSSSIPDHITQNTNYIDWQASISSRAENHERYGKLLHALEKHLQNCAGIRFDQPPLQKDNFLKVSAGEFVVGSGLDPYSATNELREVNFRFDLDYEFEVARYPVLIPDYEQFIQANGYSDDRFWTESGVIWRNQLQCEEPRGWKIQNQPNNERLPISGVTFFEAVAYCNWYTTTQDDGFLYRLPTETEWEKTARGGVFLDKGLSNPFRTRVWPWGNTENLAYGNTSESKRMQVVAVDEYVSQFQSPYGVVDLSGNLREWCMNIFDDPL